MHSLPVVLPLDGPAISRHSGSIPHNLPRNLPLGARLPIPHYSCADSQYPSQVLQRGGWLPRLARFLKVNHGTGSCLTGDR